MTNTPDKKITVAEGSLKQVQEKSILDNLGEYKKFEMDGITFEYIPASSGVAEEYNMRWKTRNGEHGVIEKAEFWAMCFLIADEETRQKMIPVKLEEKRTFYKTKTIRLTRPMRAGEQITVPFKFTVPLEALIRASNEGILLPKN